MSVNNESSLVQKEVEGDLSFENVVDIWLNADRYRVFNNKEDYNSDSKTEVIDYESDKSKKCADVLVNLTNINTDSSETERKDKNKKSADARIPKSIKNPAKDCKSKKARNDKNKKKATKKESTLVPMKCLGSGQTFIKKCVYKTIKWDSYTKATRQLLMELFPRTVLATHSLSGKKSPAFQNKPAKQSLDVNIISDIIETVCRKSDVKENLVRHAITIKCADEAKMLRQREKKGKKGADNNQGDFSDQENQKQCSDQQNQKYVSDEQNQGHVSVQHNQGRVSVQQNQEHVLEQQNQEHVSNQQNQGHQHISDQENGEGLTDQENFCKELRLVPRQLPFGD